MHIYLTEYHSFKQIKSALRDEQLKNQGLKTTSKSFK